MGRLLRQGTDLGALGFSTDQVVGNPGPGGTALPGQICGEDELLQLAAVLGEGPGPGLFTMANAALLQGQKERIDDLAWHQRLAAASGRPVVVGPIFDSTDDPGGAAEIMDLALDGAAGRIRRGPPDLHPPLRALDTAGQPRNVGASTADADGGGRTWWRRCRAGTGGRSRGPGRSCVVKGRPCRRTPSSTGAGTMCACATRIRRTSRARTSTPSVPSGTAIRSTCCSIWLWRTTSRPRWLPSCGTATTTRWHAWSLTRPP